MILNQTEISVEKSSNFEATDFRIDAKYRNKVLWMLINQYRFKIRTPIQEIVSNARDAHRENGNPERAIKIQLPTRVEPTFIVRDFGVGMDEQRIKTIFTSFGASTKNASNEQTGGFGIGAKSPLAYTDQFNIKTYVDGTYWFYVVSKTENEGIGLHLLATGETTEENGTEVQIPVKPSDVNSFIRGACRSTMFWNIQPEFNLDKEDLYQVGEGLKISDDVTIYPSESLANLYDRQILLVVDGIPYEIDSYTIRNTDTLNKLGELLKYRSKAVIKLNTGDINLLQTRESIEEDDFTLSQLSKIGFKAFSEVQTYIDSCLNAKHLTGRIGQYQDLYKNFNNVKTHTFDLFKLGNSNLTVNDKLNLLAYSFRGKSGQRVTKPQKQPIYGNSFKYDYLTNIFWDDIGEDETDIKKGMRLRNALNTGTLNKVMLIKKGSADNYTYVRSLRMLGAKKLSSLPLPERKKRDAKSRAQRIKTEKVKVHFVKPNHYSYSGTHTDCKDILLSDNSIKFVYIPYSKECRDFNHWYWVKMLKESYNVQACRLSDTVIKKVKNDPNFITWDVYKANMKPTEAMIEWVMYKNVDKLAIKSAQLFVANERKVLDKLIVKMAKAINLNSDEVIMPNDMRYKIEKEFHNKITGKYHIGERLMNRIDTRYPQVSLLKSRADKVNYINKQYRGA